ncbi:restriction endonuclease subunit S [Enterococcus faecalis]|nr:restriction endonuclease subunit S [Enterococcus faecalis]
MMSKKSPQLRFEGFTDDWEERKLSDIADRFDNLRVPITASDRKSGDTPYYGANGIQDYVEGFTHDGEFILVAEDGANDLKNYPVQYVNGKVWVNNHAHVLQGKNTITDNKFLMNSIKNFNIEPFLVGGGRAKLNADVMMKLNILLPTFDEQEKIGSFFSLLDDTIALHQRKLDLLKEQKKGYLQKMFPKNGAKVPELRFAGFADDWEERKFENNIVSIQTGTNLLGTDANEGTPLLKMGNIQRGYFSFNKLEYLDSNSNVESENIVNYGDFLFNTRNTLELVGKGATWTGMSGKYAFNSNIARFKFNGIDTIFFNYLYNTQQVISQVHARAVGTTSVAAVYPRDLNSLLYYLPSIEEQKKIGSFFNQLDNTIALHQRKLDLLKEQKKGFLQKMFV